MKFSRTYRMILPVAAMTVIGGVVLSCQKEDVPESGSGFTISVSPSSVEYDRKSAWISVNADCAWSIEILEGEDWIKSISPDSGTGIREDVRLSFGTNVAKTSRTARLVLNSEDGAKTDTCAFIQQCEDTGEVKESQFAGWLELPEKVEGEHTYFISHPMTLSSKKTRNFSICYDTDHLVSHWVAYPLNAWTMQGKSGRTEVWGNLDPNVPRKLQPYLSSPFSGGWARGHQIPSADRQVQEYNKQTYYGTNLTPQDYAFNGTTWARLEGQVRTWANRFDTLYVATGCVVNGSTRKSYDSDGKMITVPAGYFKALLGYKRNKSIGITSRTGGYTGVGFYFSNSSQDEDYMKGAMLLSELEERTGFTFFTNLPSAIGESLTETVKTTKDNYWWN